MLVNNAGRPSVTDTESLEEEEWREVIDTNLTGAFLCAQAAASVFIPQRSGVVINISSIFGRVALCDVSPMSSPNTELRG